MSILVAILLAQFSVQQNGTSKGSTDGVDCRGGNLSCIIQNGKWKLSIDAGTSSGGPSVTKPISNTAGTIGCNNAGVGDAGCVGIGAQTFPDGVKTFLSDVNLDGGQININWNTSSTTYFPRIQLINPNAAGITSNAWVNDVGYATNNLYGSTYADVLLKNWYVWVTSGVNGYKWYADGASIMALTKTGILSTAKQVISPAYELVYDGTVPSSSGLGVAGTGALLFYHSGTLVGTWKGSDLLAPNVDDNTDLGSASKRWKDLYLSGNEVIGGYITASSSKTKGVKVLTAGTGTVTVVSGAVCNCSLNTGTVQPTCSVTTTTLTITGTGTDSINYICL